MVSSPSQSPVDNEVQVQEKMSKRSLTEDELDQRRERRKLTKSKSRMGKVSLAKQVNDTDGRYPMPLTTEVAKAMTVAVGLKHPNGEKSKTPFNLVSAVFSGHKESEFISATRDPSRLRWSARFLIAPSDSMAASNETAKEVMHIRSYPRNDRCHHFSSLHLQTVPLHLNLPPL